MVSYQDVNVCFSRLGFAQIELNLQRRRRLRGEEISFPCGEFCGQVESFGPGLSLDLNISPGPVGAHYQPSFSL
jgi:hypothetical protein